MRSTVRRRVFGFDVAIKLAAERGIRAETAADKDVIALDLIAVLGHLHLAADQADIADVMLRAGMRAAGQMDIDRRVELRRALRTIARSPRHGAWYRRRRACSRHCRCRRPGRRGSRSLSWSGPSASIAASAARPASATPEIKRFCQTVRRISPSPNSRRSWRARASAPRVSLPTGSTTPIQ